MSTRSSLWTKQLKVIIDVIYESDQPLTADKVYNRARTQLPNISLGTVYRNLKKLETKGIVSETYSGRASAFLKHPFQNSHFECESCHRIMSVPVEINTFEVEKKIGLQVRKWNLHLTGVCKECEIKCT